MPWYCLVDGTPIGRQTQQQQAGIQFNLVAAYFGFKRHATKNICCGKHHQLQQQPVRLAKLHCTMRSDAIEHSCKQRNSQMPQ
jgi:hypothetical protein